MEDRREQEDRRTVNTPVGEENRSQADRRSNRGLHAYQNISAMNKRDDLIKQHLKLVSFVASRLAIGLPSWVDKRDLINAGVIGLIEAANNFDPAKGVKFESYATARIRGSMLDELRALDWIPRSTRTKSKEIETAVAGLISTLGRFPNDTEIAKSLGWDMAKYFKAIEQVSGTTLLSLDEMIETTSSGEQVRRIDTLTNKETSTLDTMEHGELLQNVVKVLKGLSEQERLTVSLYYYEELTLKEIGQVMNVSESRVSQIHTTAILKLRAKLRLLYAGL